MREFFHTCRLQFDLKVFSLENNLFSGNTEQDNDCILCWEQSASELYRLISENISDSRNLYNSMEVIDDV